MSGGLLRTAYLVIVDAIAQLMGRVAVVIAFLIALAFVMTAASTRLTLQFGSESANLILAGCYAILGLLIAGVLIVRSGHSAEPESAAETEAHETAADGSIVSPADRELLLTALSSLAPVALPKLVSLAVRSLPLIAAVVLLILLISQGSSRASDAPPSPHQSAS
jgi:hypothetical protein